MTLRHERAERHTIQVRKGDNVKVIAGKDAGKSGRVLSINAKKNTVVVEHVGIIKRHTRPNPSKNIKGGIVEKEAGIKRLERDGRLRKLRQAHPDWPHRAAGRHESPQLPPLQHDAGQVKGQGRRRR